MKNNHTSLLSYTRTITTYLTIALATPSLRLKASKIPQKTISTNKKLKKNKNINLIKGYIRLNITPMPTPTNILYIIYHFTKCFHIEVIGDFAMPDNTFIYFNNYYPLNKDTILCYGSDTETNAKKIYSLHIPTQQWYLQCKIYKKYAFVKFLGTTHTLHIILEDTQHFYRYSLSTNTILTSTPRQHRPQIIDNISKLALDVDPGSLHLIYKGSYVIFYQRNIYKIQSFPIKEIEKETINYKYYNFPEDMFFIDLQWIDDNRFFCQVYQGSTVDLEKLRRAPQNTLLIYRIGQENYQEKIEIPNTSFKQVDLTTSFDIFEPYILKKKPCYPININYKLTLYKKYHPNPKEIKTYDIPLLSIIPQKEGYLLPCHSTDKNKKLTQQLNYLDLHGEPTLYQDLLVHCQGTILPSSELDCNVYYYIKVLGVTYLFISTFTNQYKLWKVLSL